MSEIAVVFDLNDKAGFYSVFFFLVQAYIYAKKHNYRFYISHSNWYYKHTTGWHDYFTSLEEFQPKFIANFKHIFRFSHMVMHDSPDYCLNDYILAIQEIYQLRPELIQRAEDMMNNQIKDTNFQAIFIRRGDKISYGEAPLIETEEIIKYTHLNSAISSTLFVQTDDSRIISEMNHNLKDTMTIFSTVLDNKYGSYARFWKRYTPEERKLHTEEMLVGLYICTRAQICHTDYTSNVGRFLKLANFDKTKFYMKELTNLDIYQIVHNPAYGFID